MFSGWAAFAAGVVVVPVGVVATAMPAAAQDPDDGVRVESTSTYVIDPPAHAVHVAVDLAVTNQIPDQVSGGTIRQAYFPEWGVPMLAEATNLAATGDGGRNLAVHAEPVEEEPSLAFAVVDLAPDLFFGNTRQIHLTYDLPDQPPRSATAITHVNEAFAVVFPFPIGDAGITSVKVVVPDGFEVEMAGDSSLSPETLDGYTSWNAVNIADPFAFSVILVARDDENLSSQAIEGDHPITVHSWPGDDAWLTFVAQQVKNGLPVLEGLVGRPWPVDGALDIDETVSPYLYGYAGWYSQDDNLIEIGDELDPIVVLHEMAHAWFNEDLFDDRWVSEGLAEEFAARTLEQEGQPLEQPQPITDGDPAAIQLDSWGEPRVNDEQSEAIEQYAYNSAFTVMRQLTDEIGVDGMARVVAAADLDQIAYQGDPDPEHWSGPNDWRRLLDLLEEVGGSTVAEDLFTQRVLDDPADVASLQRRTEARTSLAALASDGDGWTAPLEVRQAMGQWHFDEADDAITAAHAVLDGRDELAGLLEPSGTGLPSDLEAAYESADDLADVQATVDDDLDAAHAAVDADSRFHAGHGIFGSIGLLGSHASSRLDDAYAALAAGDADGARAAAADVVDAVDGAGTAGIMRLLGLVVLLAAVVLLVTVVPSRLRGRKARRAFTAAESAAAAEDTSAWAQPVVDADVASGGPPEPPPS